MFRIGILRTLTRTAYENRYSYIASKPFNIHAPKKTDGKRISDDMFTSDFTFVQNMEPLKIYRVMDQTGTVLDKDHEPNVSKEFAIGLYKKMSQLYLMDDILSQAQRHGRINTYKEHLGEEAALGAVAALGINDLIYDQYQGPFLLIHSSSTIDGYVNQYFDNMGHNTERHMYVHYGRKKLAFQTISSLLGTQAFQTDGGSSAFKLFEENSCSACFLRKGVSSEGDIYAGLDMSTTLNSPVIFFCTNKGFTTSNEGQDSTDGKISHGIKHCNMDTIQVDGNDVWAVYNATKMAREITINEKRPVLIESMTYHLSNRSTSNNSNCWMDSPVTRFRRYLIQKDWWDQEQANAWAIHVKRNVIQSIDAAEKKKYASLDHPLIDVYQEMPEDLIKEQQELTRLIEEYPDYHSTGYFAPSS